MGKEIIGLIAIVLLLQFALSVLHPSLQTVSKCALSALALCSAFSIILSAIDKYEPPDFTYESEYGSEYNEKLKNATEEGICLEIADKYKINEEKISVTLSGLDTAKMRADYVYVRINDLGVDYRSIRAFIANNFVTEGGKVEVELIK